MTETNDQSVQTVAQRRAEIATIRKAAESIEKTEPGNAVYFLHGLADTLEASLPREATLDQMTVELQVAKPGEVSPMTVTVLIEYPEGMGFWACGALTELGRTGGGHLFSEMLSKRDRSSIEQFEKINGPGSIRYPEDYKPDNPKIGERHGDEFWDGTAWRSITEAVTPPLGRAD